MIFYIGDMHLIAGNHDLCTLEDENAMSYFESVEKIGYVKDNGRDVVMCHYPMAEWNGCRRKKNASYHIYSHIHNRISEISEFMRRQEKALNAGCMINGYEPCTLDELEENNIMKKYIMVVCKYEIEPDMNMHYNHVFISAWCLIEDGTIIKIDTREEARNVTEFLDKEYTQKWKKVVSANRNLIETYVREDYWEEYQGKRKRGRSGLKIMELISSEIKGAFYIRKDKF